MSGRRPAPEWPADAGTRRSRHLLRMAGWIVPQHRRRQWLMEWEAELWQLRTTHSNPVRLVAFLTGALWHALWEKKEEWTMDTLLQDVRYAFRTLSRSPGFALAAILLLATGIGGSTALFSVLKQALLSPPPFEDPDRLVVVDNLFGVDGAEPRVSTWSYPRFIAMRDDAPSLQNAAGYALRTATLTDMGEATLLSVETVTPSYFELLGIEAVQGRTFGSDEEDRGAPILAAMVGYGFWQTRMGSDPGAVGSTLTIDRVRLRVVGVLPEGFNGLTGGADVWVPLSSLRAIDEDSRLDDPWNQYFHVAARLAPGVALERARAEVQAFGATLMERFPPPTAASNLTVSADVLPYLEARVNPLTRASMFALFGAVFMMLLAATANVAALLLARGASRDVEAALRASLGAGRGRLLRQLLTESLTLAVIGGVVGIGTAWLGLGVLARWLTEAVGTDAGRSLQYVDAGRIALDLPVLLFAIALTCGVGILFGILPAWQAARTDPGSTLRGGGSGRGHRGGGKVGRGIVGLRGLSARSGLIVLQVGLAVVLLTGATLTLRSLAKLQAVDLGFDTEGVLAATYTLTADDQAAGIDLATFHLDFLERVRALPGVLEAALGEAPMVGPTYNTIVMASSGRPDLTPMMHTHIRVQPVSDGHRDLLGAPMIAGRPIESTDTEDTELVVVLNRTAAAELFPDGGPVGRTIQIGWPGLVGVPLLVVGVMEDMQFTPPAGPAEAHAFFSIRQAPRVAAGIMVRTAGDPNALISSIRGVLNELNPNIALTSATTLDDRLSGITARPRVVSLMLTVFAGVALFLVAVGLYGVVAFNVVRRTREIGVRASLGADQRSLVALILRQGMGVTALGIVAGLVGAFLLTPFLGSLLFDVQPLDPIAYAGAAVALMMVSLVASYLPARRATRIDPMSALRSE